MADRCLHYFKLRDHTGIDCTGPRRHTGQRCRAEAGGFYVEWEPGSKFDGLRPKDYHGSDDSEMMVPVDHFGHPVGPPERVAEPGNAPANLWPEDETHEVVLDSHGSCKGCIDRTDE